MKHHIRAYTILLTSALLLGSSLTSFAQEADPVTIETIEVVPDADSENTTITPAAQTAETETESEIESETESESEIESETESESEIEVILPEEAVIPQGIYEIAAVTEPELVLDVKYCEEKQEDLGELQTYASLNINQQKFYVENLPGYEWRISTLHSGKALTANKYASNVTLKEIDHTTEDGISPSQVWTFRKAGDGVFYIQSSNGKFLTLSTDTASNGTTLKLADFTGAPNQQWIFNNTWISSTDTKDTDISNPYVIGGENQNLSITIHFGDATETLDAKTIAENVTLENHVYTLSNDFLTQYVDELSEKYSTLNQTRPFTTTDGRNITIKAGNYGWNFDKENLLSILQTQVSSNAKIDVEAIWTQTGFNEEYDPEAPNDFGDSYIEVDLGNQKVYLYKDGKLIHQTDCVSGLEPDPGRKTPEGVYAIYYMNSPAVLRGPDYESYVDYWMAFSGGYGLHDANWRSEFGGDIWKTNGSHGCINLPIPSGKIIYETITKGYPVILYY